MANNLTANPMVITGSVTSYKSQTASALGTLRNLIVDYIRWEKPAVIGQEISIGDPVSGLILADLVCSTANQDVILDWTASPRLWTDFAIDVFPSGTLYIYTR